MSVFVTTDLRTTGLNGPQRWLWNVRVSRDGTALWNRQGTTRTFVGAACRLSFAALASLRQIPPLSDSTPGSSADAVQPPG